MFKWLFGSKTTQTQQRGASHPDLHYPDSWIMGPASAGINVNQWNAMQLSAVYACIRVLSETVAQLPLNVHRRTKIGSELANEHPLHNLLHNEPNAWMTSFVWREISQGHLCSWGNAYSYIERNKKGEPLSLFPLLPDRTCPVIEQGRLFYTTTINEQLLKLRASDVLHIPALGFDGVMGLSPISLHREAIGLGMAAQTFGARFFGSGATLAGILKHPGKLKRKAENPDDPSPVDRLRRQFSDLFAGLNNSHKVAVLEEGMNFERIGVPPNDAQFLETRKFQITEIARVFNVPSHMINDLDHATFNNISELSIGFLRYTMTPWLVRWEQEINRKLFITPQDKQRYFVKFSVGGLLRGTSKERAESYKMGIEGGWLSRNEVRKLEDLNPVQGLDQYLVPLNMGDGQKPPAGERNSASQNEDPPDE